MFSRKNYLSLVLSTGLFFFASELAAEFRVDIDYSLAIEAHTEDEDREISGLQVNLNDDYNSSNLTFLMNLETAAYVEHGSNQDNNTFQGAINSAYHFTPSTSWIFDMLLSEIASETAEEIDVLTSQTVTTVVTGPTYSYTHGIRGSIGAELLASSYDYEESVIDGDEVTFSLGYEYPIRESISLTTSLNIREQRYDLESESINDARTEGVRIALSREEGVLMYEIFIEQAEIEFLNQEQDEESESYGISTNYEINSRSNAILQISKTLEQTFSFNQSLLSPIVPVLSSGLVEVEAVSLQYIYQTDNRFLSAQIFRNDIHNISDFGVDDGAQKGLEMEYRQNLNDDIRLDLSLELIEEEIVDEETETLTVGINYWLYETSRILSYLNFVIEERDENGVDEDDAYIEWITVVELY